MNSGIKEDVHNNDKLVLHKICHIEDIGVKHAGEIKCHKKHTDPVNKMLIQNVNLESHYITDPESS